MITLDMLRPADRIGRRVRIEKYKGNNTARQPYIGKVRDFKFRALVEAENASPLARPQWLDMENLVVLDEEYQKLETCKHGFPIAKKCVVCAVLRC